MPVLTNSDDCYWLSPNGWLFYYANGWHALAPYVPGLPDPNIILRDDWQQNEACQWKDYGGKRWYSGGCFVNPSGPFFNIGVVQLPAGRPDCEKPPALPPDNPANPPVPPPDDLPTKDECCSRIDADLQAIVDAIKGLKLTAEVTVNNSCDRLDTCLSGIRDSAGKCIDNAQLTCKECCERLKSGAELTASEAAICIECICEEKPNECSQASGMAEGDKCTKCGKEPCCCKDNLCQPCEEPDKDLEFIGYCNRRTGNVTVRKRGDNPPQPLSEWSQVSFAKTEVQALSDASFACQPNATKPPTSKPARDFDPNAGTLCDYDKLQMLSLADQFLGAAGGSIDSAYFTDIVKNAQDDLRQQVGNIPIAGPVVAALLGGVIGPLEQARLLAPKIGGLVGCKSTQFHYGIQAMTALGLYSKWTGMDATQFADQLIYAINASCPRKHLGPAEALTAYLANVIDKPLLDAHWRIAGYCPDATATAREAARSRPNANELVRMRFRELISESEFSKAMRENGYTVTKDVNNLFESQRQLPGLSDIIRFMVRDADDDNLAKQFGLDDKFGDKYQSQLKKWSAQQGIDEKIARYAWRSHWEIPSPTQLFQFWRRLRYDERFGGKDKLLKDIKDALVQQDILPFWQDHYLAVSFNPMTRVDTRRAFNIGSMDEKQVTKSYLDQGYSDENADILTKFTVRLRDESAASNRNLKLWTKFIIDGATARQRMLDGGLPQSVVDKAVSEVEMQFATSYLAKAFVRGELPIGKLADALVAHGVSADAVRKIAELLAGNVKTLPAIERYRAGTISRIDAGKEAVDYGMSAGRAFMLMDAIDIKIDIAGAKGCINALHNRFLLGELDAEQSINAMLSHGISVDRANQLAKWWGCEQKAYGKAVPTSTLCEWFGRGNITEGELNNRLEALGYDDVARSNLIIDCRTRLNLKANALAKKQAMEQAQQDAKERARAEKVQKQIQQAAKELSQARQRQQATKQRRQKQLESAADKVIKKCGCDLSTALSWTVDAKTRLAREFGLDVDETLQAMLLAVDAWDGLDFNNLTDILNANAQLALDKALAQS